MGRTPKEIIHALHVIQDECDLHESCSIKETCPLYNEDRHVCAVSDKTPHYWKLAPEPPAKWSAFKPEGSGND